MQKHNNNQSINDCTLLREVGKHSRLCPRQIRSRHPPVLRETAPICWVTLDSLKPQAQRNWFLSGREAVLSVVAVPRRCVTRPSRVPPPPWLGERPSRAATTRPRGAAEITCSSDIPHKNGHLTCPQCVSAEHASTRPGRFSTIAACIRCRWRDPAGGAAAMPWIVWGQAAHC